MKYPFVSVMRHLILCYYFKEAVIFLYLYNLVVNTDRTIQVYHIFITKYNFPSVAVTQGKLI
jgi:hypothetical protein